MSSVVAIHQPNYLPWLGYFHKMDQADVFVLLDNVQFPKGSYGNRVKIKCIDNKLRWLTVPVQLSKGSKQCYHQIEIAYDQKWQTRHANVLRESYFKARYFGDYFYDLAAILSKEYPHLGSFYRNRRPSSFIRAVELLIEQGRIPENGIKIRFIGKNAKGLIPDRLPFVTYDYMPHNKLNRFRLETHALLLILDTSPQNVGTPSGKLYEYIASNRPIIGIVPPGGVAQKLIEETRTGYTTDSDPSTIADTIENLYTQWRKKNLNWNPNWEEIKHYTRRNLTRQLADQFDQLIDNTEIIS